MKSLATGCPNLEYVGYFSAAHQWEYLPCSLFLDEKNNWNELSSASWLCSQSCINEVLRVLSTKKCIHRSQNVEYSKVTAETQIATKMPIEDDDDEGGNVYLYEKSPTKVGEGLFQLLHSSENVDDSESSEDYELDDECVGSADITYTHTEINLDNIVLQDNRDGLAGLTVEEIGDNISFIQHFIMIVLNEIKSNRGAFEYPEMKSLLLNRRFLQVGFASEIGKHCAFWPRTSTGWYA